MNKTPIYQEKENGWMKALLIHGRIPRLGRSSDDIGVNIKK